MGTSHERSDYHDVFPSLLKTRKHFKTVIISTITHKLSNLIRHANYCLMYSKLAVSVFSSPGHLLYTYNWSLRDTKLYMCFLAFSLRPENRRSLVRPPARPIVLPRIDDSHCYRVHSSLTAVHCFYNGYVGKQPVAWIKYCA